MTLSLAIAPAGAAPLDPSGGLVFDFGCVASPVADGALQVANTTTYDAERGYGLSQVTDCRDRGGDDALLQDFTNAAGYSFLVDLPPADYHVTVHSGDAIASNRTNVTVQGTDLGEIFSATGQYGSASTVVPVTDGRLTIEVSRDGRINAVEIARVATPTGLHVAGTTLLPDPTIALAWDAVPEAAHYVVYRGSSVDDLRQIATTDDPTYVDRAVDLGLTYAYAVTMVTAAGVESPRSEPVAVDLWDPGVTPPSTPERVRVARTTTGSVTVEWRGDADALAYYVERASGPDGPFTKIATVEDESHVDDVVPSRNYHYRVYAVGLGGLSDASPVVSSPVTVVPQRQMEHLADRGLVAVPGVDGGILTSWRMFGTDASDIAFHVYRDGSRLTNEPTTLTNFFDPDGTPDSSYQVAAVVDGAVGERSQPAQPWPDGYLDIPLQRHDGGAAPDGTNYEYHANDASAADLDGDGMYDLVVQWEPSNSRDNSQSGYTGPTMLDGMKLDGTLLWRINMGRNIRAGAHYTQFLVYDFDGDGRAEVVVKTADGTVDGQGNVIGDADADYRNSDGYVLDGPEFLTVFDGATGAELATTDYHPPRGNVCDWGDCYGNRVDRFLAGVAYLDGERPSFVMTRGYYTRTVLAAYDWRDGEITQRWVFDSDEPGNGAFAGQGNHQLSVADVDGDGRDEIIFGQMAVDDDGSGMYSLGLGTGDAMHVSDFDPTRPGLEVFGVQEDAGAAYGYAFRDAATGEILWGEFAGFDVGRGTAGDIDPRYPGAEAWAINGEWNSTTGWLYSAAGELISNTIPPANHMIWWDGDLLREVLDHTFDGTDGVGFIGKWDWDREQTDPLLTAEGTRSNNGTKGNPSLTADLVGDWREEALWRTADSSALRLYATPYPTEHRLPMLMHDQVYRLGIAWQNVAYNQPPHTAYFLGDGMEQPPTPHIRTGELIDATVRLAPPVLNAGNPTTLATVRLPSRSDVAAVAADTVRLLADGAWVPLQEVQARAGSQLLVRFDAAELAERLGGYTGTVELVVTGHLTDGRSFAGAAEVRLG